MDIQLLTRFFVWCTILNGVLLMAVCIMCMFAQDFIYHIHSKWFDISRENFAITMYAFAGIFKMFFLFFNLIPCIALIIIK